VISCALSPLQARREGLESSARRIFAGTQPRDVVSSAGAPGLWETHRYVLSSDARETDVSACTIRVMRLSRVVAALLNALRIFGSVLQKHARLTERDAFPGNETIVSSSCTSGCTAYLRLSAANACQTDLSIYTSPVMRLLSAVAVLPDAVRILDSVLQMHARPIYRYTLVR